MSQPLSRRSPWQRPTGWRTRWRTDRRSCECWLAALDLNQKFSFGKPMFWAFIVPLGLVLLYNAVLLGLTSLTTCRVDHKLNSLTQKFLVSFSLAVLLGLSWTLGYLVLVTMETANLACSVLFCL
uniref:Adhesion G protein-coupled receptor G7, tandem duplicate 1 n=1 Tax=Poecilia reticulata TaxID=8081 RepID=A0A3P9P112_POERE